MYHIHKLPVLGKFHMPGRGFQIASENIHQFQPSCHVIQQIYIDMIHPQIRRAEIFIVTGHFHTAYMGPEIPLRNAAHSLTENFIRNGADTAVFIQTERRDLSVMITRRKQELILIIRGQITAAHAVDGSMVDIYQCAVFFNAVGFHAHIRDRIQIFFIMGDRHIRGIGDLHLVFFRKPPVFQIHIIDLDAVTLLIVCQCAHRIG